MPGWAIGLIVGAVVIIAAIALVAWWVSVYNKLVRLKQRVGNGWSQIEKIGRASCRERVSTTV